MYRQACGMTAFDVRVLTDRHNNAEKYPARGFDIQIIPSFNLPGRPARYIHYLLNYRSGFFRVTHAEECWWRALLALRKPNVILSHFGTSAVRILPFARWYNIPLVVHFHGADISKSLRNSWYADKLKKSLRRFDACVVVAEYQRRWLISNGVSPENISLIPCGVPIEEFMPSAIVAEQPCVFLSVGRFVPKKRHDYVLRAFAKCREVFPDARLTIIGSGSQEPACRQLAKDLDVHSSVAFLGKQGIERVKLEMLRSSVFVQHSVTSEDGDMEGWPVSIAEAAASGLPIIATRHAGINQQVDDGVTGVLVDEHDWEAMGDAMIRLAHDSTLRQQLGAEARHKISEFDTAIQIQKLEKCLRAVAVDSSPCL